MDIDNIFKNETVRKIVDPLKRKTYPYIITGVCFNILMMCVLVILTHKVVLLNKKVSTLLE